MKVELLFLSDCPNYLETWSILEDVLQSEGVSVPIEMIRVQTAEDAQRLRFPGSPTIRVNGRDIEDGIERKLHYGLRYRGYERSAKPRCMPGRALIRKAVNERLRES